MSQLDLSDVMRRFEQRFELTAKEQITAYEQRDSKIQELLTSWANSAPHWAKDRYQYRLERALDFCLNRRFVHVFHNTRTREIIVSYGDRQKPEMSLSITSEYILARDSEARYIEILFPRTWPNENPDLSLAKIEAVSDVSAVEW